MGQATKTVYLTQGVWIPTCAEGKKRGSKSTPGKLGTLGDCSGTYCGCLVLQLCDACSQIILLH